MTEEIYKVSSSGIYYNSKTEDSMIRLLEEIKRQQIRVRFHWGNIETGEDWGDVYDVEGRIGNSTGPIKIPILVHNRRSLGGGSILTHCIVKIVETKGKKILYIHPKYHVKKGDRKHGEMSKM